MADFKFNLGDEVKDRVTGLKGIVTCRIEWLNGCLRYGVQPQSVKDGARVADSCFDQGDLVLVKSRKVEACEPRRTGGPQPGDRTALRRV